MKRGEKEIFVDGQFVDPPVLTAARNMESALEKYFTQFSAKYEDPEECRQHCLEKHLKYFCIDHCCKEPKEVKNYAANLVKQADYGELDSCERKSYVYSGKKWNREEAVYKLTKNFIKTME